MSHRPNVAGDCDHNKYDRPSDGMVADKRIRNKYSYTNPAECMDGIGEQYMFLEIFHPGFKEFFHTYHPTSVNHINRLYTTL